MRIIFKDDRQKQLFESKSRLNAEYGDQLAKKIMQRLLEVDAASCLEDLRQAPGKWHELAGDRKGQLACSLTGNWRLIFLPIVPSGANSVKGLDWKAVA
ncbi:MAG: killer suppression protein [Phycisphaerales bacterium]|nr:killer suppression protein [Phycisphaerales bacterium]